MAGSERERFRTWLTTKKGLIFRKSLVAFIVGFFGVLIPAGLQILDEIQKGGEPTGTSALLVSLVVGAFAAGIRAALAVIPGLNLSSTDSLTSIGSKTDTVTVTTNPKT